MTATHLVSGRPSGVRGSRAEPPLHRPTWAEIDLGAIRRNVAALKTVSRARLLLAAVKADGYGHGLIPAARAALQGGADWLGVAMIEEAERLREDGIDAPVLVLNEPPAAAIPPLLEAQATPVVYTRTFIDALDAYVRQAGAAPYPVHIKLDTGMRRVGAPDADWEDILRHVAGASGLHVQGLMSHLAVADDPSDPFTAQQAARFARGVELAASLGIAPEIRHLANSAATMTRADCHYDMVRPGIAMYGLDPGDGLIDGFGLVPALSWWTRISLVKRVRAGEAIGYGQVWTAERDTTIATVPVGYGDGLPRRLSNVGEVVVGGRRARICGRVSMDQTLVAVPEEVGVAIGDEVALIGGQRSARVTAENWAAWLDTINYEVTTTITGRVPRVYLDDETDVGASGQG